MSAEGGGQGGGGGVEVFGDMRASALQGRITRQYPQLLYMMDFVRQQKNNRFCVLYALNNIIQCSPFLSDKTPYTVPDMVNACNQVLPKEPLPDRPYCNEKGNFTFQAVNWLLEHHPIPIPKSPLEDRERVVGHETLFDFYGKKRFSRQAALEDLDKKLITVGFMLTVKPRAAIGLQSDIRHAIAIVNLQPLTLANVNFVVIDSEKEFIWVSINDQDLFKYLEKEYYLYFNTYVNIIQKMVNDKTVQELKSLHEESETPLSAGHSYYQF